MPKSDCLSRPFFLRAKHVNSNVRYDWYRMQYSIALITQKVLRMQYVTCQCDTIKIYLKVVENIAQGFNPRRHIVRTESSKNLYPMTRKSYCRIGIENSWPEPSRFKTFHGSKYKFGFKTRYRMTLIVWFRKSVVRMQHVT